MGADIRLFRFSNGADMRIECLIGIQRHGRRVVSWFRRFILWHMKGIEWRTQCSLRCSIKGEAMDKNDYDGHWNMNHCTNNDSLMHEPQAMICSGNCKYFLDWTPDLFGARSPELERKPTLLIWIKSKNLRKLRKHFVRIVVATRQKSFMSAISIKGEVMDQNDYDEHWNMKH
ncbi:hypothetical protein CAPTEDRAFT_204044 [Capitella teleta]|uniref:Uncharacterized protein n=1 Tax=Capitella teleta TaxID=283909 RepID=R7TL62_CAPTE|nr:hypothetical protein CAPTEDRAFT_204044 [Capitella teleta]|eukprot:ELT94399.1 hypothetical protein CAPTEDRAFT_204044 [Capitella teleta]